MRLLRYTALAFALLALSASATAHAQAPSDPSAPLELAQPKTRAAVRAMSRPAVVDIAELRAQLGALQRRADRLRARLDDADHEDNAHTRAQTLHDLDTILGTLASLERRINRAPRLKPLVTHPRAAVAHDPSPTSDPSPGSAPLSDVAFANLLSEIQRLPPRDRLDRLRAESAARRINAAQARALIPLSGAPLRTIKTLYPALDRTLDAHTFLHHLPPHQRAEFLAFALQQPTSGPRIYMSVSRMNALKVLLTTLPEDLRAGALRLALRNNRVSDAQRNTLMRAYVPRSAQRNLPPSRGNARKLYQLAD